MKTQLVTLFGDPVDAKVDPEWPRNGLQAQASKFSRV
jgi:hypothetical protein